MYRGFAANPGTRRVNIVASSLLIEAGMGDTKFKALMVALVVGAVGVFLKGAWDDAQEQIQEAANPPYRWSDKNRWE